MVSVHALTFAWPMRIWICLSKSCSMFMGSAVPPYTPLMESVPPRRTVSMHWLRAVSRSTPPFSIAVWAAESGSRPTSVWAILPAAGPVRLHADGVYDRVRPAPVGHLADRRRLRPRGRRRSTVSTP